MEQQGLYKRHTLLSEQKEESIVAASLQALAPQDEVVAHGAFLITGGWVHESLAHRRLTDGLYHPVGQGVQNLHILHNVVGIDSGQQPLFAEHVIGNRFFIQAIRNHITAFGSLDVYKRQL